MLNSANIKSRCGQAEIVLRTVHNIGQYFFEFLIAPAEKCLSRTLTQRDSLYTVGHHCRCLGIKIVIKSLFLFNTKSGTKYPICTAVAYRFSLYFSKTSLFSIGIFSCGSLQTVFVKREPIFLDASLCSMGILDAPRISSSISSASTSSFSAYS